jgi:C1A family cysteine protease
MKTILLFVAALLASQPAFAAHNYKLDKKKHAHHALGLKRDKKKHEDFKKKSKKSQLTVGAAVPGSVDLTSKVSPPENQGSCGSCWDFSITKALRSAMMLAGNDPGVLAFNYLLDNCGGVANESGCGGGDFDAGENMLNGKGPWLESQDPYQGRETRCQSGLSVAGTALTWNLVGDGNTSPTFQQLAQAVSGNHVLSVDVAVCGEWENYSSGIFDANQCGANSINHMINMVGYNCETSVDSSGNCVFNGQGLPVNGDGYLLLMNNWGTTWGEAGYMRSRYGVDAIATTAMYFDVQAPVPPAPAPTPVPPAPVPTPSDAGMPLYLWLIIGSVGLAVIAVVVVKALKK